MELLKPWYLSRTIWASLIAVLASVLGLFGFVVQEGDVNSLAEALTQAVAAIAALVAIIGRIGASSRIR